MNSNEFQEYLTSAIENYALEKTLSGNWPREESLINARAEFVKLLPKGEKTQENYLYNIQLDDQIVGMLWLARKSDEDGFIYDINIMEGHRGLGYGKVAVKLIEKVSKEIGIKKIGLQVFGHNKIARRLYEDLGYKITNIKMVKEII
ncbi:GNAT family N-acetyltransferase [Metabacillus schmidteae]|uniref:GNAT family N-acetyltransferase n=1 Tax=Metabacillus schmidteae TaxID=2730405 RepID=UPI0015898446|nr:GNAT family N-acetyltransferase [Metabacillus schmidteae]